MGLTREETLIAFPVARDEVPVATHVRSAVLVTSQGSLRRRGHYERYAALLAPEHHLLLRPQAPGWLPFALALGHYDACYRLELSNTELVSIGNDVEDRLQGTFASFATKLATAAGVTPWTILTRFDGVWARMFQGSAVGLFKIGPKEARVELAGWPLAYNAYNRVSFRGVLAGLVRPFCSTVYVRDLPDDTKELVGAWRVSWS